MDLEAKEWKESKWLVSESGVTAANTYCCCSSFVCCCSSAVAAVGGTGVARLGELSPVL